MARCECLCNSCQNGHCANCEMDGFFCNRKAATDGE